MYVRQRDAIHHMRIYHDVCTKQVEAVLVEVQEKSHICGIGHCQSSYAYKKNLKIHQRKSHGINLGAPKIEKTLPAAELQFSDTVNKFQLRFPCDFPGCLHSYMHKKDIVRHRRICHNDLSKNPIIPDAMWYTASQVKYMRQKMKQKINTTVKKLRLDSTGSSASISTNNEEDSDDDNVFYVTGDHPPSESNCSVLMSSSLQ